MSLGLTGGLVGCATSNSSPLAGIFSAVATEALGAASKAQLPTTTLNLNYRYLRVEVAGRPPALLVLGYVDSHPQGDIEVWYSAQREVIKTQNGRIVGTAGLETDWRAVSFPSPPPPWADLPSSGLVYQRLRDEMPAYRYGVSDRLEFKPWDGLPPIDFSRSLTVEQARTYRWFRVATLDSNASPLPPAWFAWGPHRGQTTVVYSEQCLSARFCLKLQRWPPRDGTS